MEPPSGDNQPFPEIRDKQSLPLQIPYPSVISDRPAHFFPTQGDLGCHIKKQLNVALAQCSPPSIQQENDYRRLGGLKYHENRLRLLTCVFEGVTTRIIGQRFNLICSPDYHRWLKTTLHHWLPILPPFDVCSQDPSLSQDSNPSQNDPTQYNPSSQPTS